MDIKEIALKIAEEMPSGFLWHEGCGHEAGILIEEVVEFAEALIESYKAELLNEAGEPVAYYDPDLGCGSAGISFDPLSDGIYLYTSNQVAAVILKVTKSLKEEVARYRGKSIANADRTEACLYENQELRAQLAAAQEEIANETAEAIAKFVAFQRNDIPATGIEFAEVIRSGAWKGFKR